MFGMCLSAPVWNPTLRALRPEVTQFVFVHNASIMYFLFDKERRGKKDVMSLEQNNKLTF